MSGNRAERLATLLAALFLAGYFWRFWSGSLRAEFTGDDLMNCYRAVFASWTSLVRDNVMFFRTTPVYRPFPELLYKAFFAGYGFDLFAFRILLAVVMALNVVLMYSSAWLLTGRREIGLLAALLGGVHRNYDYLLYSTGTLYDIFCFFFYFAALVYYLRIRKTERVPGFRQSLVIACLLILALDSKEMAVSFPVMILLYELWKQPPRLQYRELVRWLSREGRVAVVAGVIAMMFVFGRVMAANSLAAIPAYRPHVTPRNYLTQVGLYLGEIFYSPAWFDKKITAIFLGSLIVCAALRRSGVLLWSWALFAVGILPLAFIPARSLTAALIPVLGLVIYTAAMLAQAREKFFGPSRASQAALFVLVAFLMVRVHRDCEALYDGLSRGEYAKIRTTREQLLALNPSMPPESRLLFLNDPFGDSYGIVFLVCLAYGDNSLVVDQLWRLNSAPDFSKYDHVFRWQDGNWTEVVEFPPARCSM